MYIIYFWITLVLWKGNWRQDTLGFAFNVHYHGLDEDKKIKIRISPQISCMHLTWSVEFKSVDEVYLCLGVFIIM